MKKIVLFILIGICVNTIHAQSDSTLKELTGRYLFPEGGVISEVTVILEGDQLSMSSSVGTSALTKLGVDSFTIVEYSGLAVFKRGESKAINGIFIDAAGYIMTGVKENTGIAKNFFLNPDFAITTKKYLTTRKVYTTVF